jgi:5-formyltetrahydrofolate cyclo-ligase
VAYAALPGEIDPSPIVDAGLAAGKTVYFPRLQEGTLKFLAALPSALRPGAFAIPEPLEGALLLDKSSTLFLVPGVAFDSRGTRLGRGGGHYDRALADHAAGFRLGLAADSQLAARLPHDDWDQPMDGVITEQRMLWSAARSQQGD